MAGTLEAYSNREPVDYFVYDAATFGKAVATKVSESYARPRDDRELAIGIIINRTKRDA